MHARHGGVVLVQVDTAHEHGCEGRWRGDDHFLRATLQMGRSPMMLTIDQDGVGRNVNAYLWTLHKRDTTISILNQKRREGRMVEMTIYSAPAELH